MNALLSVLKELNISILKTKQSKTNSIYLLTTRGMIRISDHKAGARWESKFTVKTSYDLRTWMNENRIRMILSK